MHNIRNRIEIGFSLLARKIHVHRVKTLLIMTVVVGALFSQLPKVKLDTSMEGFLHPDDPAVLTYNQFRDQFGRDEVIIVALESDRIFDFQFLETLKSLHRELEAAIPVVEKMRHADNFVGKAFTMMVASIAIGLAVDDTIHFMHNFRRYYEATGDPRLAVFKTLHTTGRAMLVTTIVLSLGFFIYMFSTLNNIIRFGILTGITLIAALLADYFLAPALMVLVNKQITVDNREPLDADPILTLR